MRKPLALIAAPVLLALSGWLSLAAQAPDGVVTGRVLGADGNPAAGVEVVIVSLDADGRVTFLGRRWFRAGWADRDGMFRIENVPAGRYGVVAAADGAPTYFPGTYDAAMAGVVTVDPGGVTSGIDFSLSPDPPTVWAGMGRGPFAESRPGPSPVRVPGRLVIEGVDDRSIGPRHADGSFELFFSDGSRSRTGTVEFPLGSTGEEATTLEVRTTGGGPFWFVTSVVPMPWAGEGTFQLVLPEGDYRVAPAGTPEIPGFYIRTLSYGGADLTQERMDLRSNAIDELVITLAACPGGRASPCEN